MIITTKELNTCIKSEKNMYLPKGIIKACIVHSKNYEIYKFQKYLRREEFYGNNLNNIVNKVMYGYYKRRKNILGQKLGFDIPINCFGPGLQIHHVGPITINADAQIGKNCNIAGNICIGSNLSGEAPQIGDNCTLGYGCIIIGNIKIADNTIIGAGAVVTKSSYKKGAKLAGIPAKNI